MTLDATQGRKKSFVLLLGDERVCIMLLGKDYVLWCPFLNTAKDAVLALAVTPFS